MSTHGALWPLEWGCVNCAGVEWGWDSGWGLGLEDWDWNWNWTEYRGRVGCAKSDWTRGRAACRMEEGRWKMRDER